MRSRRKLILILLTLSFVVPLAPAQAYHKYEEGVTTPFCPRPLADEEAQKLRDNGIHVAEQGGPAVAQGPASQIAVHSQVFGPAFGAVCPWGSGLLTYLGLGERAGIEALLYRDDKRHFGLSSVPMSAQEWASTTADTAHIQSPTVARFHHVPLFIDIHAVGYNLPSSCTDGQQHLNFRSEVLSQIFSGRLTKWNDPLLMASNPSLADCALPIRLVKRADFSASSLVLKDYLSKRNPQWNYYKQPAQNTTWPTVSNACPALGDGGMAACIRSTPNSIGYLPRRVAGLYNIPWGRLDGFTSAGEFIEPGAENCTKAGRYAFTPPIVAKDQVPYAEVFEDFDTEHVRWSFIPATTTGDWSAVSLTDPVQGGASLLDDDGILPYPMCSLSYAFMFSEMATSYPPKSESTDDDISLIRGGRTAVDYLLTAIGRAPVGDEVLRSKLLADLQKNLNSFGYASLPDNIADVAEEAIEHICWNGCAFP